MLKLDINKVFLKEKQALGLVFLAYITVLAFSLSKHELWGDEVHSWNIAKESLSIIDLISNTRYEGHPPVWYVLLFLLSKFTHNPFSMQYLHFCICGFSAFIFLFFIQFRLRYKVLILFGYYFLYEYGVFSRNYSIGILLAFLIVLVLNKKFKHPVFYYYILLFFLSNTHFLAFILALSFHAYFLAKKEDPDKLNLILHGLLGLLILMPAAYFIFPPSNSSLNTDFWLNMWNKDQLFVAIQAPLKALAPVPAWWDYHFWNTHALLQAQKTITFLKYLSPIVSLTFVCCCIYILYPKKKILLFFTCNLLLTLSFALVFPLVTARYVGFIFIGFVISLVLAGDDLILNRTKRALLYSILSLHILSSVIAGYKDWRYPFSHVREIKSICALVPTDKLLITDYWCLNYLSAFKDKPFYCLGFNKEKSFLLWDEEMKKVSELKNIYSQGTQFYFQTHETEKVYFITNTTRVDLVQRDSMFFKMFDIEFIIGQQDAIEKYSNINLYKITKRPNYE